MPEHRPITIALEEHNWETEVIAPIGLADSAGFAKVGWRL